MVAKAKRREAKKRVPLAIYVPREVLERLQVLAERDRRSLSTKALLLIEDALAREAAA